VSDVSLAYPYGAALPVTETASEEDSWVERARAGEVAAFDTIMQHYEGRLLRFLGGIVGDAEVAQELCQDTFLAAYQALPRTKDKLHLSAWLHTIALNRARSFHRRKRLRSFLPFQDEYHAPVVADTQEHVATHDAVRRVLARMPSSYVQPLLLQTASGLSCREISEVLGCSEGAVKVRLLRAREAFKKLYAEQEAGT
jgi:RNA polymerase sigma-70 factor (ECF subfamily)